MRAGSAGRVANGRPPIRVAVLTSRRAPGIDEIIARSRHADSPYVVEVIVASDPASESRVLASETGLAFIDHDLRGFYALRGARLADLDVRAEYDAATASLLAPRAIDVVVCCGYLHLLTEPMLDAYPDRIINIHDADLAIRLQDGRPRYSGLRSTRDALFAGERETRSTVHLVTRELDAGPILARSIPFPVHEMVEDALAWGATDLVKACAWAQREWMMRASWGELLHETLVAFADAPAGAVPESSRQLLEVA